MRRALAVSLTCAVLTSVWIVAGSPITSAAACSWTQETAPSPKGQVALISIDGAGEDLWTVGASDPARSSSRTLIEHRTPTGWVVVPSPNRGDLDNQLAGVKYLATDSVWAVGQAYTGRRKSRNLAVHWDGTSWTQTDIPSPHVGHNVLWSIDGLTTSELPVDPLAVNEMWAVGDIAASDLSGQQGQILHHDGATWSVETLPTFTRQFSLRGVDAVSADDVWAAGVLAPNGTSPKPLALHYDGTAWTRVTLPSGLGALFAIRAAAADNVWLGGFDESNNGLLLHYDGTSWSRIDTPPAAPGKYHAVYGIDVETDGDVRAVGLKLGRRFTFKALIMHGVGTGWSAEPSPSDAVFQFLLDVIAVPEGPRWAVGASAQDQDSRSKAFVIRCG